MTEKWEPKERKSFPFELEEKDGIDSDERTFKGFAAVMGNFDGKDIIEQGAFKKTIKEGGHRVKIYWIHNWQEPIGKALELKEVSKGKLPQTILDRAPDATGGLFVKGYISRIPQGDRALEQMKDGTLNEMSIGFDTVKEEWEENEEGIAIRHLKEIRLYDVSPVPLAMNPAALVTDVKEFTPEESKPYPNEHSCRLEDPAKYDTCRRGKRTAEKPDSVKGKEYVVIYCKKGDGPMEQQAFRYPKDNWTAAEASAHCKYNKGQFEAATEEEPKGIQGKEYKFAGSPKNRFGTHASYGFKGDYAAAWKCHFSKVGGGNPSGEATGPIRGTVRRCEMIAAVMKPACQLPDTESIGPRKGPKSPLQCTFPSSPADYGLSGWDDPEDEEEREKIQLTCSDLAIIKRAALAEIKRRAEDAEEDEGKTWEPVDLSVDEDPLLEDFEAILRASEIAARIQRAKIQRQEIAQL